MTRAIRRRRERHVFHNPKRGKDERRPPRLRLVETLIPVPLSTSRPAPRRAGRTVGVDFHRRVEERRHETRARALPRLRGPRRPGPDDVPALPPYAFASAPSVDATRNESSAARRATNRLGASGSDASRASARPDVPPSPPPRPPPPPSIATRLARTARATRLLADHKHPPSPRLRSGPSLRSPPRVRSSSGRLLDRALRGEMRGVGGRLLRLESFAFSRRSPLLHQLGVFERPGKRGPAHVAVASVAVFGFGFRSRRRPAHIKIRLAIPTARRDVLAPLGQTTVEQIRVAARFGSFARVFRGVIALGRHRRNRDGFGRREHGQLFVPLASAAPFVAVAVAIAIGVVAVVVPRARGRLSLPAGLLRGVGFGFGLGVVALDGHLAARGESGHLGSELALADHARGAIVHGLRVPRLERGGDAGRAGGIRGRGGCVDTLGEGAGACPRPPRREIARPAPRPVDATPSRRA